MKGALIALVALCGALCVSLAAAQSDTGVPLEELHAACAYYSADQYNQDPYFLPGWAHSASFRFQAHEKFDAGHADAFTSDQGDAVIAIRGPEYEFRHWIPRHLKLVLSQNPFVSNGDFSNRVHTEFWEKSRRLLFSQDLLQKLTLTLPQPATMLEYATSKCAAGYRVTVTGHSEGGAEALFIAWAIRLAAPACNVRLVTFGAPPALTATAVDSFNAIKPAIPVARFVSSCMDRSHIVHDRVPRMHRKKLVHVSSPIVLKGKDLVFYGQKKDFQSMGVRCHYPDNYVDGLQVELFKIKKYALAFCGGELVKGTEVVSKFEKYRTPLAPFPLDTRKAYRAAWKAKMAAVKGQSSNARKLFLTKQCKNTPSFTQPVALKPRQSPKVTLPAVLKTPDNTPQFRLAAPVAPELPPNYNAPSDEPSQTVDLGSSAPRRSSSPVLTDAQPAESDESAAASRTIAAVWELTEHSLMDAPAKELSRSSLDADLESFDRWQQYPPPTVSSTENPVESEALESF